MLRFAIALLISSLFYGLLAYGVMEQSTTFWLIVWTMVFGIGPFRLLKVFFGIWLILRALGG